MYCLDLPDVVGVNKEHHLSQLLRGVADSECGLSNACVTAYMPHALQQTAHTRPICYVMLQILLCR
jgi:hypothetical protein